MKVTDNQINVDFRKAQWYLIKNLTKRLEEN